MLTDFFSAEDLKRGQELKEKTSILARSDFEVRALLRVSNGVRVELLSGGENGELLTARCSCGKGRLCKHVWAVISRLEFSDFIQSKTEIVWAEDGAAALRENERKTKFAEIRKQAYARRKEYAKAAREKSQGAARGFSYPGPVEEARRFFESNGFPLEPLAMAELIEAKRKLARVFHPDKGGSHEETVVLNENFEILAGYLKS